MRHEQEELKLSCAEVIKSLESKLFEAKPYLIHALNKVAKNLVKSSRNKYNMQFKALASESRRHLRALLFPGHLNVYSDFSKGNSETLIVLYRVFFFNGPP